MRAALGLVSLLVVLAVVGLLATRQRAAAPLPSVAASASPVEGNVREQSQRVQQQVRDDVQRALEQGATRREEADK